MGRIICVCGARPNFVKMAPLVRALEAAGGLEVVLVHTGQHYDERLSGRFFAELGLKPPQVNLEVGSGSHAGQTAEAMKRFEPVVESVRPDFVLVVGDVNSTVACALVAVKLGVRLIHVEAGLRSFDRRMPEEINRVVVDTLSALLFVTERAGVDNLRREGINGARVHLVGNVMIDTLLAERARAEHSDILERLGLARGRYGVVTLHRPGLVDEDGALAEAVAALAAIGRRLPLAFPVHPRTRARLEAGGLWGRLAGQANLILLEPAGYLDFLKLMAHAAVVLTDSGGIQEETTILGVACLTLRENTERPVTVTQGTNRLVGVRRESIVAGFEAARAEGFRVAGRVPELWDGRAAGRIAAIVRENVK